MAVELFEKCVKLKLPNKKTVDILGNVIYGISKWVQTKVEQPESGGYLLGYVHKGTHNVTIENITEPQPLDDRGRYHCRLCDPAHKRILSASQEKQSYYIGVWHTHPQTTPVPSETDYRDWCNALKIDKSASKYAFFIIAGFDVIRVWIGQKRKMEIKEIFECKMEDNLYV